MSVGGAEVNFKLDTGADISCLPLSYVKKINCEKNIKKSVNELYAYNNIRIKTFGQIDLVCTDTNSNCDNLITFEIVDNQFQPLLGIDACIKMKLINRLDILNIKLNDTEKFVQENIYVFEGLGKIPGECRILLKENSVPNLKYKKRIPDSLHGKLKEQLELMEAENVIAKVDYPTEWVNNLQIVEKPNGSIRLCLDPIPLNKCIRREHFLIPTAEEIISRLSNKTVFTVLDLKSGFWQLELDRSSSDLTTFMTPFGRYRWNRVPFGICSAPEMFMEKMVRVFGDIENVEIYFDDLFINGKDQQEHDKALRIVLKRARDNNIKFNKEKVQYCQNEVKFMGQIIREGEVSPDSKYIEAIRDIPQPKNKSEVMRLLGMFKFLARFIPNLTHKTAHLRDLTRLDSEWQWTENHQQELHELKSIIIQTPVLKIFDPAIPLVIQTDASKDGLGCVLMQDGQPIAYASRSLTVSEKKWAQIEKELLAIVFSCEKFHHFIYGRNVTIQSDHKPLEDLIKKELDEVTVRLQRMFLILLKYPGIDIKYTPGKFLFIADCLSRAYLGDTGNENEELKYVIHTLRNKICFSEDNYNSYVTATKLDSELTEIARLLEKGWPIYKYLSENEKKYNRIKSEIKFESGLLFHNDKLIVPKSLRSELLSKLHGPHLGVEKTLARARQLFYWPGISNDIKSLVNDCRICEKHTRNNCSEPLMQEENPKYPWHKTSMDILEYRSKYYIAFIDAYSGWLCTDKLKDKSIDSVIHFLSKIFNSYGFPTEIRADNSPFNCRKLLEYASKNNIKLKFSSPTYPQSNGLAEKAVGISKSIIKKAIDDNKEHELGYLILEYNSTPLLAMGSSPSQLFLGRLTKTKLPVNQKKLERTHITEDCIQNKITEKKAAQKNYYDRRTKVLSKLLIGDKVMFKKTSMNWTYGEIVGLVNERSYNIKTCSGKIFRRNRRLIVKTNTCTSIEDEIDYDFLDHMPNRRDNSIPTNIQVTQEAPQENNAQQSVPEIQIEHEQNNENQPTASASNHKVTRSGRISKPPDRWGYS